MENNQQSFWQFSDQLRVQTSNLANLSVNDSIWGTNYGTKRPEERRNFDIRVGGEVNSLSNVTPNGSEFNGFNGGWNSLNGKSPDFNGFDDVLSSLKLKGSDINGFNDGWNSMKAKGSDFNAATDGWSGMKAKGSDFNSVNDGWNSLKPNGSDFNGFNDGWNSVKPKVTDFNGFNAEWKMGASSAGNGPVFGGSQKSAGVNGGFNKGIYSKPGNHVYNVNVKGYKSGGKGEDDHGGKAGKKNNLGHKKNNSDNNNDGKSAADKRFKTLPPSESLPRNETVGGYIFVCNNDTMQENLKRQLFGMFIFSFYLSFCY